MTGSLQALTEPARLFVAMSIGVGLAQERQSKE